MVRALMEKGYALYNNIIYNLPYGYAPLPRVVFWLITNRCNLRCYMCPFHGKDGANFMSYKDELSTEECYKVIDNLEKSYRFSVKPLIGFMGGGEPFCKRDIFKILSYLTKKGFKFTVTTNFSVMNKKMIDRLLGLKPKDIRISLDGIGKTHDDVRGVKGTFDKVISNIKYIRQKSKRKTQRIRLNTVMLDNNIKDLYKMIDLARELSCDLNFQHLGFIDKKHFDAHCMLTKKVLGTKAIKNTSFMTPKVRYVKKIIINYEGLKKYAKQKKVNLTFLPDIKKEEIYPYYMDLDNYVHSDRCTYVWGAARISDKGDIFPCLGYIFGNIMKADFDVIWNNKKARRFRKNLKKYKLFPACIRCCKI